MKMKVKKKTVRRSSEKYRLKSFLKKKKPKDLNNENMETNRNVDEDGPDEEAPLIGADECNNCLLIPKRFAELQLNLLATIGKMQEFKIRFPVPPSPPPSPCNQDSVSAHVHHLAVKTARSDLEDCIRDAYDFIEQFFNNNKIMETNQFSESSDEEPDVCIKCLPVEKSLAPFETKVMGFVNKVNAYVDLFPVPTPTPPVPTPTSPIAY